MEREDLARDAETEWARAGASVTLEAAIRQAAEGEAAEERTPRR